MSPKKKLAYRDRSVRHAFIYINILKNELGLTFDEITEQLNEDGYRTREGEKYTAERVSRIWDKRKVKYRSEAFNLEMLKVPNSQAKLAYIAELRSAANELNVKLHLNPQIKTNVSESELIKALINVILTYDIHPKAFTDKTLTILGRLLFHPDFSKAKKL